MIILILEYANMNNLCGQQGALDLYMQLHVIRRLDGTLTIAEVTSQRGRWLRLRGVCCFSSFGVCVVFRRWPETPLPCMRSSERPARPTQADSRRTELWRPCVRACRGSWSARTVYTGPTSSGGHRTVFISGHSCGNGMWVLSDRCGHNIPRPGASQHLLMEAPQTATTWRRSSGLFTTRQKNTLKVFQTRDCFMHESVRLNKILYRFLK